MPDANEIGPWVETIRSRYISYLTTLFYFRDPVLRKSFRSAFRGEELFRGPLPEYGRDFPPGVTAPELAAEAFPGDVSPLLPALLDGRLHEHQERAIRAAHLEDENVVVASGTASGKTECFLYPILFSLFQEHRDGTLGQPGVRAVVLYPMNALVNDQRERIGELCRSLDTEGSDFSPTFGQYIGQTPYTARDRFRNGAERGRARLPGELVFRNEMWEEPPHILFTNFSMLEYLLIRPQDTPLFDDGRGRHWKFLVLDEAHTYRGAKGIEMAMLMRRLKQRVRDGGRIEGFRCIATSATIASGRSDEDRRLVAEFSEALFGEPFSPRGVVFGVPKRSTGNTERDSDVRRHHLFVRALEGAFLIHDDDGDEVVLNRVSPGGGDEEGAVPLEIALCRECGQHYYVGRNAGGRLVEAVRDPSHPEFGVEFFLPDRHGNETLCRRCGALGAAAIECGCGSEISVQKCKSDPRNRDQLRECVQCGYTRGSVGDPVQEIVHGADGPNAVLATALHELLPKSAQKVLAFADSRQDAAFFAWYAEDSYVTIRDRNFLLKAIRSGSSTVRSDTGRSVTDCGHRLARANREGGASRAAATWEHQIREAHSAVLKEALAEDVRLSLSGVGLARWYVQLPDDLLPLAHLLSPPWNLTREEARVLMAMLLDHFRGAKAVELPESPEFPMWKALSQRPQMAFTRGAPRGRRNIREWGGASTGLVRHFLPRLLDQSVLAIEDRRRAAQDLMKAVWYGILARDARVLERDRLLIPFGRSGAFRLRVDWLRIQAVNAADLWECQVCARISGTSVRQVCQRARCPGTLVPAKVGRLEENHYRTLYSAERLPARFASAEHTAQLAHDEARRRQEQFKDGELHLLSSSTTFEVGVDLGDLEVTFLRNVPPEPFNYAQRVGRAGRRERPGLALTYCRRSPHDLHYFEDPETLVAGTVVPPRLLISNPTIVTRHLTAMALSAFFRDPANRARFDTVTEFIGGDWREPTAASTLAAFCRENEQLGVAARHVVPRDLHAALGLVDGTWIDRVAGQASRLAVVAEQLAGEREELERVKAACLNAEQFPRAGRVKARIDTLEKETTPEFLARRAVIPKYGFPVDVVELHTGLTKEGETVQLARDLSLAIGEYAPGSRVVANKLEWKSSGVRMIEGRKPRTRVYNYDDARDFTCTVDNDDDRVPAAQVKRYLVPEFGFVTPLWERPRPPERRSERLFSTRPFFKGFSREDGTIENKKFCGVSVSEAVPGELVVLCEGRRGEGFLLCLECGLHDRDPKPGHKTREGRVCDGVFQWFSLAHELDTDVVKVQFPRPMMTPDAYSLGYSLLYGAADAVSVPERDLNVTLASQAIVLYDDVPGGAGLVAQLVDATAFRRVLEYARKRVQGGCGCDSSCYGCLRSYRNQFVHTELNRKRALAQLDAALAEG